MEGKRLTCGPFEIDPATQLVRRDGQLLPLGNKGGLLLQALFGRPGEVLTKTELMDAAWPETAVEESNLTVQIATLRKALGPAENGTDWIITVPRIGYRFVGQSAATARPDALFANKPSVAVLPFENLSGDPDQLYFTDGLSEEIITALSKLPGLAVIARNSSFAYRGEGLDMREVAAELNVSHVLTGSVRRSGNRLRVTAQLVDAVSASQIWAERYDRDMADVFAIQDDVTAQIVTALKLRLTQAEAGRITSAKARNLEALEHYTRGCALSLGTHLNLEVFERAVEELKRAIDIDPTYGLAYTRLAGTYVLDYINEWSSDPAGSLREARRSADLGVALEPEEARPHGMIALVSMMENDIEGLVRETEATLAIDPNHAMSHTFRGNILIAQGNPLAAIEPMEHAMRLDPSAHQIQIHHLGLAYFHAGKYETAAALFRERILMVPSTDMTRGVLASALGHLGLVDEARQVWTELMAINPKYSMGERLKRGLQLQKSEQDRLLDGLRLAGLPL
jgi:TolB-like protein